jgi:UPF0271 protein
VSVRVDFNCDIGESFGVYTLSADEDVMRHISSANIACGLHAGDPIVMRKTVKLAEKAGVAIGAHPGFPDLQGFGRREMQMSPEEIRSYVTYQIGALFAFTKNKRLQHVKAHGSLYNMGVANERIARAVAESVYDADPSLILVGLSGSCWIKVGKEVGLRVANEVFADRALNPDGTLVSRTLPGAVLRDTNAVIERALGLIIHGKATAISGEEMELRADTICLHGDTPGAGEMAGRLNEAFRNAGIEIAPMGSFL